MPYLMEFIDARPDEEIEKARETVIAKAEKKFSADYARKTDGLYPIGSQLGRASLRPGHVNLVLATYHNRWTHPVLGAGAWTTWFTGKTPEEVYVIIEGVFNSSAKAVWDDTAALYRTSQINAMKPHYGGTEFPVMSLQDVWNFKEPIGWFEKPVVITPETSCEMELSSLAGAAALLENIGLLGEVIGQRESLIDATF